MAVHKCIQKSFREWSFTRGLEYLGGATNLVAAEDTEMGDTEKLSKKAKRGL